MINILKQVAAIFMLTSTVFFFPNTSELIKNEATNHVEIDNSSEKKGSISILNIDSNSGSPIQNTVHMVINENGAIVEMLVTDKMGRATSTMFDFGKRYTIRQDKIMIPYVLNSQEYDLIINNEQQNLTFKNDMFDFVKGTEVIEEGHIKITELFLPFKPILQLPELPQGCEITALTSVLHFFDYEVTKTEMADNYLPQEQLIRKNNVLYGPNPYKAYAGNPRKLRAGLFSYTPPIIQAADRYFDDVDGNYKAFDLTGSSREDIIEQLNNGIPIMVWATIDLKKPKLDIAWYFYDSGEYFLAPSNLHVMVLHGYDQNNVHVMDPLKGEVMYDANTFFDSYYSLGSHAMMVTKGDAL
ncbi:C39 family peptidase [Chengkuizengella sp. SCS-71B]|uniref:C39 family peptidase n=1 Tax=Chengkuizengella sp. SCS-71B TaxID=3115290 RepID=UPI0032C22CDE